MADEKKDSPERSVTLAGVGAGILIVACCAGPALILSGALGALGGVLLNPWLIASGVVVLLAAITYAMRRHAHGYRCGSEEQCTPLSSLVDPVVRDYSQPDIKKGQHRQ